MRNKGILGTFTVLLGLTTAPAFAKPTIEATKQYIIEKTESCGTHHDRQDGVEGRYYLTDKKTSIRFDNNKMIITEFSHVRELQPNGDIYSDTTSDILINLDLDQLSTESKVAAWGKNRVVLECNNPEGETFSRPRCMIKEIHYTNERGRAITKQNKGDNRTEETTRFHLYFCNKDTATRITKAFNHLAVESGAKQELF
ncbi:MAG: hypothetical protein ACI87J_002104 [Colwellia sp.]|jgi:hypothetical protein